VLFLDIKMPGRSGLEVAGDWPRSGRRAPFPLIVFVTAYDDYALQPSSGQPSITCSNRSARTDWP
jgi:DNA-binding LytR/AlgR family response regulator